MGHARRYLDHDGLRAGHAVLVDGTGPALRVEAHPAEADQGLAGDHQEALPFAVVPVVPLRDARFGHVHGHLAPVGRAQELGEGAALVDVRAQRVRERADSVIALEGRPELLRERPFGEVGHGQVPAARPEGLEEPDDLAQRRAIRDRAVAVPALRVGHGLEAVVPAAVPLTQERAEHLLHEVVYVEQLELDGRGAHLVGAAVRDRVAEGRDGGVVPGAAPLAVQVREAVHEHRGARPLRVLEEQPLSRQLGLAVGGAGVTALEARLGGAREHDRAAVPMALQEAQQLRGEPEVAGHELRGVLGPVHAREVEDGVGLGAEARELLPGRVGVALVDGQRQEPRVPLAAVLPVADGLERLDQVPADEPLGAGDEDPHATAPPRARGPRARAARTPRS